MLRKLLLLLVLLGFVGGAKASDDEKKGEAFGATAGASDVLACPKCGDAAEWGAECTCTATAVDRLTNVFRGMGFLAEAVSPRTYRVTRDRSAAAPPVEDFSLEDVSCFLPFVGRFGATTGDVRCTLTDAVKDLAINLLKLEGSDKKKHVKDGLDELLTWCESMRDALRISHDPSLEARMEIHIESLNNFILNINNAQSNVNAKTASERASARSFFTPSAANGAISASIEWLLWYNIPAACRLIKSFYLDVASKIRDPRLAVAQSVLNAFVASIDPSVRLLEGESSAAYALAAPDRDSVAGDPLAAEPAKPAAKGKTPKSNGSPQRAQQNARDIEKRTAKRLANDEAVRQREEQRCLEAAKAAAVLSRLQNAATQAEEERLAEQAERQRVSRLRDEELERLGCEAAQRCAQKEEVERRAEEERLAEGKRIVEVQKNASVKIQSVVRNYLQKKNRRPVGDSFSLEAASGSSVSFPPSAPSSAGERRESDDSFESLGLEEFSMKDCVKRVSAKRAGDENIYVIDIDPALKQLVSNFHTSEDRVFSDSNKEAFNKIVSKIHTIILAADAFGPTERAEVEACRIIKALLSKVLLKLIFAHPRTVAFEGEKLALCDQIFGSDFGSPDQLKTYLQENLTGFDSCKKEISFH